MRKVNTYMVACFVALAVFVASSCGQSDSEVIRKQYLEFLEEKFKLLPFLHEPVAFEELMAVFDDAKNGYVSIVFGKIGSHDPNYSYAHHYEVKANQVPTSNLFREWRHNVDVDEQNSIVKIGNPAYRAQIRQKKGMNILMSVNKSDDLPEFKDFVRPINQNLNEFRGPRWAMPDLIVDAHSADVSFIKWEDDKWHEFEVKVLTYSRPVVHILNQSHEEVRTICFAKGDGRMLWWKAALSNQPGQVVVEAKMEYAILDGKVIPSFFESKEYHGELTITVAKAFRKFEFLDRFDRKMSYLSYYGIAEPDWYRPPRPWWLYSSLIGLALVVIGAIVVKYGKSLWNQH